MNLGRVGGVKCIWLDQIQPMTSLNGWPHDLMSFDCCVFAEKSVMEEGCVGDVLCWTVCLAPGILAFFNPWSSHGTLPGAMEGPWFLVGDTKIHRMRRQFS